MKCASVSHTRCLWCLRSYDRTDAAAAAITNMHNKQVGGRICKVSWGKERVQPTVPKSYPTLVQQPMMSQQIQGTHTPPPRLITGVPSPSKARSLFVVVLHRSPLSLFFVGFAMPQYIYPQALPQQPFAPTQGADMVGARQTLPTPLTQQAFYAGQPGAPQAAYQGAYFYPTQQ